jgi:hypothetical protein
LTQRQLAYRHPTCGVVSIRDLDLDWQDCDRGFGCGSWFEHVRHDDL